MAEKDNKGLGNEDRRSWPKFRPYRDGEEAIDRLKPNSETHRRVLDYITSRIDASERAMQDFYSRWRANEIRVQGYIDLPQYEQQLKEMADTGKPPAAVSVNIPYSFATISTIVTYLLHTFTGRKPMFQVGTHKAETVKAARHMETVLQYQSDHSRMVKQLAQFFNDGEVYGLGVLKCLWNVEQKKRTVYRDRTRYGFLNIPLGTERVKTREMRTVYEGNVIESIDPFMFFPDPKVPMTEVNRRGEFVFWRDFHGKHVLKRAEANGEIKYVDYAGPLPRPTNTLGGDESARDLLSKGRAFPGSDSEAGRGHLGQTRNTADYVQVDQGTIEIIPAELGLGSSEVPQKWIFTILNKSQIVQAEPFDSDHDMHPIVVTEPYSMGYGFGQPGMADFLGPIQDTSSWFINSHMYNVRTAINNMFVVDPSMVELQDLKDPGPGKMIRLKRSAYGQDVRTALQQLNVEDVTGQHIQDLQLFLRMGDELSAVNDNIRGIQAEGGRKTATEVRTAGEAAASRLASHAKIISSQAIVDLTEMMSLNTQQFLEMEFFLRIVGQEGMADPIRISPEMLVGDFHFPIHDGTLPLDRVALLDVWKEIFLTVSQDENLRQEFNITKMFDWIAELGGAKNLDSFKVNAQGDGQLQQGAQSGNQVPIEELLQQVQRTQGQAGSSGPTSQPGPNPNINATPEQPRQRAAQGTQGPGPQ
jgi:hypothetical protein